MLSLFFEALKSILRKLGLLLFSAVRSHTGFLFSFLHRSQGQAMAVQQWFNRKLRVTLPDDRVVTGYFVCADCRGNIILKNAEITVQGNGAN